MKLFISVSAMKYKKVGDGNKRGVKNIMTQKQQHGWWKKLNADEQAQYLKDHPDSKMAKRHVGIVKNLTKIAVGRAKGKVLKNRMEYRDGLDGIKMFKQGRPLSDSQRAGVKKIAKTAAVALIAGLAGIAMFTPLGGAAMHVAEKFIGHYFGAKDADVDAVVASNKDDAEDESNVDELMQQMSDWLMKQDPKELAKLSKS